MSQPKASPARAGLHFMVVLVAAAALLLLFRAREHPSTRKVSQASEAHLVQSTSPPTQPEAKPGTRRAAVRPTERPRWHSGYIDTFGGECLYDFKGREHAILQFTCRKPGFTEWKTWTVRGHLYELFVTAEDGTKRQVTLDAMHEWRVWGARWFAALNRAIELGHLDKTTNRPLEDMMVRAGAYTLQEIFENDVLFHLYWNFEWGSRSLAQNLKRWRQ